MDRFDEGPPRAAPAIFPYPGHGTLAEVWGIASEPEPEPAPALPPEPERATPALREVVRLSLDNEARLERLERMNAERAFERFSRGDW